MLFPDGVEQGPRLHATSDQSYAMNAIAVAYGHWGHPSRAVLCYQRAAVIDERRVDKSNLCGSLRNLSSALRATGALHAAELNAFRALGLDRAAPYEDGEAKSLIWIGRARGTRGCPDGDAALHRSLAIWRDRTSEQRIGRVSAYLAQSALWQGEAVAARGLADRAWELAKIQRFERDFIFAARLQGEADLALGEVDRADERLHHALTRARAVNLVSEELATLTALATLHHRRRGDTTLAREHLDAVWDPAERGPYRLLHANACNVLAEIEIAEKNIPAAVAAATTAYRLAWCDGPPFAYDYGLRTARAHLRALGAPEPDMPPFDPSQHEPIEEIDIEPDGEQAQ